ncbi:MAG: hypothetical protein SPL75_00150 [Bacilli bacterium]|nr:hypothetical protein [Bacilli bacterium]
MKKRSIALLCSLLALSVAGVATATALIVSGANAPTQEGSTDDVLYLDWGTEESLANITNLTPDAPAYRKVSVKDPEKSASAPDGKFTVTLGVNTGVSSEKTLSMEGISVAVYDRAFKEDGTPGDGATRVGTGDLTPSYPSASEVVTAAKVYYLKISISQAAFDAYASEGATTELAAKITFKLEANS